MAAGIPSGLNSQALGSLLQQYVTPCLNRVSAAALTVAFEIRRADHLSRGEKVSDDLIKQEIGRVYTDMLGITDPLIGLAMKQQAAHKRTP